MAYTDIGNYATVPYFMHYCTICNQTFTIAFCCISNPLSVLGLYLANQQDNFASFHTASTNIAGVFKSMDYLEQEFSLHTLADVQQLFTNLGVHAHPSVLILKTAQKLEVYQKMNPKTINTLILAIDQSFYW